MKVIYGISQYKNGPVRPVLVIGVFDGVHRGHQTLILAAKQKAEKTGAKVVVMTFHPHPIHVLHPEVSLPLIISLEHRLHLLEHYGVDVAFVVKFTKAFSKMSPKSFIQKYLGRAISPSEIFVGDDFRFGQNRSGSLDLFEQEGERYGFTVNALKPIKGDVGKVSSTQVRHYITEGNLKKAEENLGHRVAIMGKVVRGDSRGKSLGFPTANIEVDDGIIPPKGVYATLLEMDGQFFSSMTNIGQRPSFTPLDEQIFIETHIFQFKRNIYGRTVVLHFVKKIRDEKTFPDQRHLISQLQKDEISAKRLLKKH